VRKGIVQDEQPFDVAWQTIDGLEIRYATSGKGDEKVVLFSPWPESIFAFAPIWAGLAAVLRERLPHARLNVLEAGHCVWEERAPEFETIVTQWVHSGYQVKERDERAPDEREPR
jgi:hypothetical protein